MQALDDGTLADIAERGAISFAKGTAIGAVANGQRMAMTVERATIHCVAFTQHVLAITDVDIVQQHGIEGGVAHSNNGTELFPVAFVTDGVCETILSTFALINSPRHIHFVSIVLAPTRRPDSINRQNVG